MYATSAKVQRISTCELGQCRRAVHLGRRFALCLRHHPRDTARPAQVDPTARLPGHVPDDDWRRQELGREGEARGLQEAERRRAEATGRRQADGGDYMDRPLDPGAASSSDPAGSATPSNQQGPDQNPRTRHTWPDTGVGPEEAPDCSSV